MKYLFLITTLFLFCFSAYSNSDVAVKTLKSTEKDLDLLIDLTGKVKINEVEIGGKYYQKITVDDESEYYGKGKYPQLEYFEKGYFFAVPEKAQPSFTILEQKSIKLERKKLIPAKREIIDKEGMVTFEYQAVQNPVLVKKKTIRLEDCGYLDGNRLFKVVFSPLQITGNKAEFITNLRVKINFGESFSQRGGGTVKNTGNSNSSKIQLLNNSFALSNKKLRSQKNIIATFLDLKSDFIKLTVTESGLYKISGTELKRLGFDLSAVVLEKISVYSGAGENLSFDPVDSLRNMYHGAKEISRKIVDLNDDGNFDDDDYILFYGEAASDWKRNIDSFEHYYNKYSHENYYWINPGITVSSPFGLDMAEISNTDFDNPVIVDNFSRMIFFEDRKNLLIDYHIPYWFSAPVPSGGNVNYDLNVDYLNPDSTVYLNVTYQKKISNSANISYNVNGKFIQASTSEFPRIVVENPEQYFDNNSKNRLTISNNSSNKNNYLESYEFIYSGKINGSSKDNILFGAKLNAKLNYRFKFEDVADMTLYDITDPANVKIYPLTAENGTSFSYCNIQPSSEINYFLLNSNSYKIPQQSLLFDNSSSAKTTLHAETGRWNMVIIAPETDGFYDYLKDDEAGFLEAHKKHNGSDFKIKVINMTDINNEFGRGYQEPAATRNFIRYAHENWGVEYVLLAGDGTVDPRNEENFAVKNYIYTSDPLSSTFVGSDSFYGNLWESGNDAVQHVSVGRFTVDSRRELESVVEKTVDYITNPDLSSWRSTVLFVGDDERSGNGSGTWNETHHIRDMERSLVPTVPNSYLQKKVYLTEFPFVFDPNTSGYLKPEAEKELIRVLNEGVALFCYLGHGAPRKLAHEQVFLPASFAKLNNYKKYHLMMGGTCHFGVFDHPTERGLGEEMLVAANKGAIGLINCTVGSYSTPNRNLFQKILSGLFEDSNNKPTVGKAFQAAQNYLGGKDAAMYMYFGDPALKIFKDLEVIEGENKVSLTTLTVDSIKASVADNSDLGIDNFNGTLNMIIADSEVDRKYFNEEHWSDDHDTLSYTLPGNRIISTLSTMKDGESYSKFVLPKDLNYGESGAKISFYAHNEELELTGSIDTVSIKGAQGAHDNTPPQITVKYNDLNYQAGDPVGQNPVIYIEMYDVNGINTSGGIGHKMLMEIDGNEIELNNYFSYFVDSYQKGYARYQLIGLSEGKHIIKASAWDTYNNYSEVISEIDIIADDENSVRKIGNIVNYPNPIKGSGTTFTFSASNPDDLKSFKISIYTINGRKIKVMDSYDINFENSYQTLKWDGRDDDGDIPANGVYFYKVEVKYQNKTVTEIEKLMIAR